MNISQPHLLWSLLLLLLILGPWVWPSGWNSGKQVDKSNPSFNTFIESLSLLLPCFCQTSWALFTCSQMDILLQMSQNVCLTSACRVMSRSHRSCFSLKALLSSTSASFPATPPPTPQASEPTQTDTKLLLFLDSPTPFFPSRARTSLGSCMNPLWTPTVHVDLLCHTPRALFTSTSQLSNYYSVWFYEACYYLNYILSF